MAYKQAGNNKRTVSAREVAMDVLTRVEQDRAYSNLLLNDALKKAGLERADAGLATELVYGTIQRLNTIDYFLNRFVNKGVGKLQPWVRALLRLSFYQIRYLERIPEHAAVNEAVNLAKRKGHTGISGMVNGVLRNVIRQKASLVVPDDLPAVQRIALQHSHPEWLVARWTAQLGEAAAAAVCEANNAPPSVSVRVNSLRGDREALLAELAAEGRDARPSALAPAGIVVESGGNMALTAWYERGRLSVQDESSMLVAEAVAPEPGMRVLDCCAAPGGKTAHMAEAMRDEGTIEACDIHDHKRELIDSQARRLGLKSIRTHVADARRLQEQFPPESFDRILLDAPCSGFGVIRRKPDLKWSKQESEVAEIRAIQRDILWNVHKLLKPGGVLVYSTCTIERSENEEMVAAFLQDHPDWELDPALAEVLPKPLAEQASTGMVQLLPQQFHSDGFFIARLRKRV